MSCRTQTVVLHRLAGRDPEACSPQDTRAFDPCAYSRMKYGSRDDTRRFATQMAGLLRSSRPQLIEDRVSPRFLIAYKAVQPACGHLTRYVVDLLNRDRLTEGLEPASVVQIHKDAVTATDYSTASESDRLTELAGIGFTLEAGSVDGRETVILDDVRVTGAAEGRVVKMIDREGHLPSALMLAYVASVDAERANTTPQIESEMNAAAVRTPADLVGLIRAQGGFDLNIRALKMILGADDSALDALLPAMSDELLDEVLRGALGSGADFVAKYDRNYERLSHERGSR